jgi:hypothetical protein
LQGFTLVQGRYRNLPLSTEGELVSRELGLILRPQGDLLRLVDCYTHQVLLTSAESIAQNIELQQELDRLHRKKD